MVTDGRLAFLCPQSMAGKLSAFMSVSRVFQSYQDDVRMIMKGSV